MGWAGDSQLQYSYLKHLFVQAQQQQAQQIQNRQKFQTQTPAPSLELDEDPWDRAILPPGIDTCKEHGDW